jgi:hypothetical protein
MHKKSKIVFYCEGDEVRIPEGGILLKGILTTADKNEIEPETDKGLGMKRGNSVDIKI